METSTATKITSDPAEAALEEVRAWLGRRRPACTHGSATPEIGLDLDLLDHRIVDSLSFMSFIHFLEELSGRSIETRGPGAIKRLRTLRSIRDHILRPEGVP